MCLDPKDLNRAIIREHYKALTLKEITPKLSGSTIFSKFDSFQSFYFVHLGIESSMKTTFNTTPGLGRHSYLCHTMGMKNRQDVYQMKIDQFLKGLNGVIAIHDDITVFGKDGDAHDQNLIALMERAQQVGLTFNNRKCMIRKPWISFIGVLYSENNVSLDPKKIQGILGIQPPTDVTQLQSFLGVVNFMDNFIPHLFPTQHHFEHY